MNELVASARTMLTTNASKHHAVASSTAAQASAMVPRRDRLSPRSVRMRARTGNAVTDSETPMNNAKPVKLTSRDESFG